MVEALRPGKTSSAHSRVRRTLDAHRKLRAAISIATAASSASMHVSTLFTYLETDATQGSGGARS